LLICLYEARGSYSTGDAFENYSILAGYYLQKSGPNFGLSSAMIEENSFMEHGDVDRQQNLPVA